MGRLNLQSQTNSKDYNFWMKDLIAAVEMKGGVAILAKLEQVGVIPLNKIDQPADDMREACYAS